LAELQVLTAILIPALFIAFAVGIVIGTLATWRLDWLLLQEHPDLHREWQLGQMWIVWRSPDIYRRLRLLRDPRITRLLNQINAISLFLIAVFGALVVVALAQQSTGWTH
jgi:hypothetical protein